MIEIFIYIALASIAVILSQMLSGQDNGVFYAKGLWWGTGGLAAHPDMPRLSKLIIPVYENLHRNESPSWYCRFGAYFFLMLTILRLYHHLHDLWICILSALLMTMGSNWVANVRYQGYINVGAGEPYINPNEQKLTEFYIGRIHFKRKRLFSGKKRVMGKWIGVVCMLGGLIIGFML